MSDLKNLIKNLELQVDKYETSLSEEIGKVVSVKDGVVKVKGIRNCMSKEVVQFENGEHGIAFNLEENEIGIITLGDYKKIRQGMVAKRSNKVMSMPVGQGFFGRVINPLGLDLDGKGKITPESYDSIEKVAPGVIDREPVNSPLSTGLTVVDALVPIGKGQRQLIIGDRQTGKSTIALEAIINQKNSDVFCIYVSIGQKKSKVANLVSTLQKHGAMEFTTVVLAGASDPASLLYLAPYSGITLAEYFSRQGKDVLIVYDDLTKHANAYREMSLLLRRPAGREAYPGDIFYLHSRLLERAVKLNATHGGGSITALPIIETQLGDLSTYIPTNVISITDGQIFLESSLFFKGIKPAVNIGASVSRVGSAAQLKPLKKVAGPLKLDLAQFRELEAFAQLSSDLDKETKNKIDRGKRIIEVLKQKQLEPLDTALQTILIYAVTHGYFNAVEVEKLSETKDALLNFVKTNDKGLINSLNEGKWDEKEENEIKFICKEFFDNPKNI